MSILKEIKAIPSTKKDLRSFAYVVGGVFAVLGALWTWKNHAHGPYFLAGGLTLAAAGLLFPSALKPLQKAWMTLAVLMGFVMTRLLLSVLFFLIVTPIGLIARLCGKKFMEMRFRDETADSYWNLKKADTKNTADYQRQF